jgi:uncharacterized protein YjbI with pentapeptide repeats
VQKWHLHTNKAKSGTFCAKPSDRQQEEALQAYIDSLSELLLHEKLRQSAEDGEVRSIARVRTLTVLPRLDGKRKRSVVQFLYESGLIHKDKKVVDLSGADLSDADLDQADLRDANLSGARLVGASLILARLIGADLNTANLASAVLRVADLSGADLSGAWLIEANLSSAKVTDEQLSKARTFKGAIMPDENPYA